MGFISVDSTDAEKEYSHRNLASPFIPLFQEIPRTSAWKSRTGAGEPLLLLYFRCKTHRRARARDPLSLFPKTGILATASPAGGAGEPPQDTSPSEGTWNPVLLYFRCKTHRRARARDPLSLFSKTGILATASPSRGGGGDDMKLNVLAYRSVPGQVFAGRGGRDRDPRDGFASARGRPNMESL